MIKLVLSIKNQIVAIFVPAKKERRSVRYFPFGAA
jgi:hypothetical protein